MWVQVESLVLMDGLRYYQAPGCPCAIPHFSRSDKKTCSAACRKQLERSKHNS